MLPTQPTFHGSTFTFHTTRQLGYAKFGSSKFQAHRLCAIALSMLSMLLVMLIQAKLVQLVKALGTQLIDAVKMSSVAGERRDECLVDQSNQSNQSNPNTSYKTKPNQTITI